MMQRVQELCRKLKPVLGSKVDRLWAVYLAESDAGGKADLEQTLELLAAKHLGQSFEPDRSPFPPPPKDFSLAGEIRLGNVVYGGSSMYPFYLSEKMRRGIVMNEIVNWIANACGCLFVPGSRKLG